MLQFGEGGGGDADGGGGDDEARGCTWRPGGGGPGGGDGPSATPLDAYLAHELRHAGDALHIGQVRRGKGTQDGHGQPSAARALVALVGVRHSSA